MLTLPNKIVYNTLKSFWVVLCTTVLVLSSIIAVAITDSFIWLSLLLTIPLFSLIGVKYPNKIVKPYAYFNAALRRMVSFLQYIVLLIVHSLVFVPLKLTGDKLKFSKKDTMWEIKKVTNLIGEKGNQDVSLDSSQNRFRFYSMLKWIVKTKKWWVLAIIPYLFVLSILSEPIEDIEVASDTYTLY